MVLRFVFTGVVGDPGSCVSAYCREMPTYVWFVDNVGRVQVRVSSVCSQLSGEFCVRRSGCGGNVIASARAGASYIWANDIDPTKMRYLRHNASVYQCANGIESTVGDAWTLLLDLLVIQRFPVPTEWRTVPPSPNALQSFLQEHRTQRSALFDVVMLAPPWGGMDYTDRTGKYDLRTLPIGDFFCWVLVASLVAENLICLLPRNVRKQQLQELYLLLRDAYATPNDLTGPEKETTTIAPLFPCAVENLCVWQKCKMCAVYFGKLAK